jgi:hypothetical protein
MNRVTLDIASSRLQGCAGLYFDPSEESRIIDFHDRSLIQINQENLIGGKAYLKE